ncbi:Transcription factor fungi [Macrophomina phaseolina MS6]|uniref:Transcription factor fungi n=2 Tax=Macrophomina phaseolina TaxID=35725 RepID=K2S641_MACPH|nr:Transcription factor fungi [Macrophomina phaseolina MS6]
MSSFEARCQQIDHLCQKMDAMLEKFNSLMDVFDARTSQSAQRSQDPAVDDLRNQVNDMQGVRRSERSNESPESDVDDVESLPDHRAQQPSGHLVSDSQGKLRYVGGTTNLILIEAVQSLGDQRTSPIFNTPGSTGSHSSSVIGLPFFSGSSTSLRLPMAMSPDQVSFPPQYVSDLLVHLYFDQLHYTFPILFKPYFMRQYGKLAARNPNDAPDPGFLCVFFAVCACASGLLPRPAGGGVATASAGRPGQEFYEKSWLLYYGSTGQGTIEQVQCLALLSVCSAGWNTLTQAWKFAGQAVRTAQDLGLHTGLRRPAQDEPNELLMEQMGRRVWWSVYGLDRLLSMCLGRPMAADDDDCDCGLPLDMADEQLEVYCRDPTTGYGASSALAGFLAFSELCKIASKIVKSTRTVQRALGSRGLKKELQAQTEMLDRQLQRWLQDLPDVVKFSPNRSDDDGRLHLTMCIITFILHAASIINLQRPWASDKHELIESPHEARNQRNLSSAEQCVQAARSCIHTAELILFRVPPSHYLAFSVHQLGVAGILLLRTSPTIPPPASVQEDVQKCIGHLGELESVWSGAERSKAILQDLLRRATEAADSGSFELFGGVAEQRDMLDPDFFVNFEAAQNFQS